MNSNPISHLKKAYNSRKSEIISRSKDFEKLGARGSENRIFEELCFCLLTPQAKAKLCWETVNDLKSRGLLLKGEPGQLSGYLNKVRFKNNKAVNLVSARKKFIKNRECNVRETLEKIVSEGKGLSRVGAGLPAPKIIRLREWLVENVRGYGLKEASHFLRNIGLGRDICILDRHILKNLVRYGVIREVPRSLGRNTYLDIESKMLEFSKKIRIPVSHLDLLFWSMETGEVFK